MDKHLKELLEEYDLTIDDIRWMLSVQMTERILALKENPGEITDFIWSGKLDGELYNMEERYLDNLAAEMNSNLIDETYVREQLAEASGLKCRRPGKNSRN